MVKSKLPPPSGSSFEAIEPHPLKGVIKIFYIYKVYFTTTFSFPLRQYGYGILPGPISAPLSVQLWYAAH